MKREFTNKFDKKTDQIFKWKNKKILKWTLIMIPIMIITLGLAIGLSIYNTENSLWYMIIGVPAFAIEREIYERNVDNIRQWTMEQKKTIDREKMKDELRKMK